MEVLLCILVAIALLPVAIAVGILAAVLLVFFVISLLDFFC